MDGVTVALCSRDRKKQRVCTALQFRVVAVGTQDHLLRLTQITQAGNLAASETLLVSNAGTGDQNGQRNPTGLLQHTGM